MPAPQTSSRSSSIVTAVISGLLYGLSMGVFYSIKSGSIRIGIIGGVFSGIFFGVFFGLSVSWFVRRQVARMQRWRPDFGTETVLLEGPANHFKGAEGVGGYLWLTTRQLHFRSHKFNLQNHEWSTGIRDIADVEAVRTLGIVNNGLLVKLSNGGSGRFVVHNRIAWLSAVEYARKLASDRGSSNL